MPRPHYLFGGIALAVITSPNVLAQSRTATMTVSAVVVRSCAVQANAQPDRAPDASVEVSVTCSGSTAHTTRLEVASSRTPSTQVIDQPQNHSRVIFHVMLAPGDTLVTLQF